MSKAARIRHWVHGAYRFAKTTVIGGLVFVVPLFVLVWLGAKALKLLRRVAEPLAALLPLDRVIGVLAADALLVAALIVVCFMGGLLARVSSAYRFVSAPRAACSGASRATVSSGSPTAAGSSTSPARPIRARAA